MIPTGEAFVNSGESNGEAKCLMGFAFFAVARASSDLDSTVLVARRLLNLLNGCDNHSSIPQGHV